MTDHTNHRDETPPNWDRYADLLRKQPRPEIPTEHVPQMMQRIDAAIEQSGRRTRIVRWVVAPTLSAAAAIAFFIIDLSPPKPAPQAVRPAPAVVAQNSSTRSRPNRRVIRKRLPPPMVTFDEEPDVVVEMLPAVQSAPVVPHEEPVGPGPGPSRSSGAQPGGR